MGENTIFGQALIKSTVEVQTYNEVEINEIFELCQRRISKYNIGISVVELIKTNGEIVIPNVHDFNLVFNKATKKENGIFEMECEIKVDLSIDNMTDDIHSANITLYDFRRTEYKFKVLSLDLEMDKDTIETEENEMAYAVGMN
jgi:hypothetical protein